MAVDAGPEVSDSTAPLERTVWTVTAIGGEPVPAEISRTVSFAESTVSGRVGVNRFRSRYDLEDDTLKVGPVMATKMRGPGDVLAVETRLHRALEGRHQLSYLDDDLVIGSGDEAIRLTPGRG